MPTLTEDQIDDILYLSRTNETIELREYLDALSAEYKCSTATVLQAAVDAWSGNTALHYAAANGHIDTLTLLTTLSPPSSTPSITPSSPSAALLNAQNTAGNTPLHWAALNGHLACVQLLVRLGADVTTLNTAGHDAVFEAEINDKEDVVKWMLGEGWGLESAVGGDGDGDGDAKIGDGEEVGGKMDVGIDEKAGERAGLEDARKKLETMDVGGGEEG
ncbi:ankyrin [Lepidopterella palustris CBS 459.81]|uniref:Ankyrin n=1 Tax=Lepidopterella palustris CBS 459.81 TaxID=1314670 RepID=A0A8E2EE70_9PEZI|nr:ankyrin [Lepidopterella palustris CBS 459.81]